MKKTKDFSLTESSDYLETSVFKGPIIFKISYWKFHFHLCNSPTKKIYLIFFKEVPVTAQW